MINRKETPAITDAVDFTLNLKPYDFFILDNGVPVYTIDAGAQEVIQLEWVFYAGNSFEGKNMVAAATNFLLKNGTSTRSAYQLNEDFEYYGAYCNRACQNETATVTLHTLTKHLDHVLPVVNDMITNATFAEEELSTFKQNSKQRLSVNLQKCEFVAARLIDSYLYGQNHPYGKYSSMQDLDELASADLIAFYQQHYVNGRCAIFVSGKLPLNIQSQLNRYFGQLSLSKPTYVVPPIITKPADKKKYRIQNDENSVQGAIRIATNFPNRHHPDFKKVVVLNNIFGGFFGSRLMSNIREDKGYTYGIHSYIQNHLQETAWMVSTEAGKDVCDATITEVYNEMKLLRETLVDEEELSLVRNYMMGGILGDLDGPFHIMAKWKNIILNGMDKDYFYDSIKAIKLTSAEELQALAQKYLQPENFYELIVY